MGGTSPPPHHSNMGNSIAKWSVGEEGGFIYTMGGRRNCRGGRRKYKGIGERRSVRIRKRKWEEWQRGRKEVRKRN